MISSKTELRILNKFEHFSSVLVLMMIAISKRVSSTMEFSGKMLFLLFVSLVPQFLNFCISIHSDHITKAVGGHLALNRKGKTVVAGMKFHNMN